MSRRVLCRVRDWEGDEIVVYHNNTFRYISTHTTSGLWKLEETEVGVLFFYKLAREVDFEEMNWQHDYEFDPSRQQIERNAFELKLARNVMDALSDIELNKILTE